MNKKDIAGIVDELIELEPTLIEHRAILEKNVAAILAAKPDVKITPAFTQKLLRDLQTVIASSSQSTSQPFTMKNFFFAVGGALVASLALFVTVINPVVPFDQFTSDETVTMDGKGLPRPQSGGGGGGGMAMQESKMIAPGEPNPYKTVTYNYSGELTLPDSKDLTAFRRTPLKSSSKAELLTGTFVDDLINIGALKSLSVVSVNLSESGDEPLMVNVDFNDGNVSINRQINYANRPDSQCRDEACYERYRLKERDMISDSRAIEIAEEFLKKLGVDTSSYGEPVMQDEWRMWLEREADKSNFYYPEQLTVTYPYLVNGSPVYDEWGNANGMTINVDVRLRAAIGLWGLRTMNLVQQDMRAVTNPEALTDLIRTGGVQFVMPQPTETTEATLGAPELVYMSYYHWDQEEQVGYETYYPALSFPITVLPTDTYEFRKAVVVPLAQDYIDMHKEEMGEMPVPYGEPMPVDMMEGEAG